MCQSLQSTFAHLSNFFTILTESSAKPSHVQ